MRILVLLAGASLVSSLKMHSGDARDLLTSRQSEGTEGYTLDCDTLGSGKGDYNWVCLGDESVKDLVAYRSADGPPYKINGRRGDVLYIDGRSQGNYQTNAFNYLNHQPNYFFGGSFGSNYGIVVSDPSGAQMTNATCANFVGRMNSYFGTTLYCCEDLYHICGCNKEQTDIMKDGTCGDNTVSKPVLGPHDSAGGRGDPHMSNINGEKFNVNREGYAPLVSITSEGTPHLEVVALIQGVKKCQKKMFISHVNSSGSWLEKNIAVSVGDQTTGIAFRVTVDGEEVWSPSSWEYQAPATENMVFNHADKFSINEMPSHIAKGPEPGIEIKTAHDLKLRIVRPLHRATAPPHLNFEIQGLKSLPASLKLGGLLGNDDHSHWSQRSEDCGANFAHVKEDESSFASAW